MVRLRLPKFGQIELPSYRQESSQQHHKDELEGHLGIGNHLGDLVVRTYQAREDGRLDLSLRHKNPQDTLCHLPQTLSLLSLLGFHF